MILKELALVFRHFTRRKLSSLIIILSIGIALSISMLLYTFIQRETLTDRFHSKAGLVYRLLSNDPFADKGKTLAFIKKDASDYVSTNYPEIRRVCKITELSANGVVIEHESDSFEEVMVLAVDTSFYNMFDYPFLQKAKNIGNVPSGIAITESLAQKIFGQTDVLGEDLTVHYDTLKLHFTITGVMGTMSENTHLKFNALVSFDGLDKYLRGSTTYIELYEPASRKDVEAKISDDVQMPSLVGPGKCDYFLQPLADVYFDKSNVRAFTIARSPEFIKALWLIVSFILLVGVFNFLNLFIISLVDRRKGFGVRRIQGATAANIRSSVAFEIFVYVFIALMVSIAFSIICLPVINAIFQSEVSVGYLFKPVILSAVAILVVGLILIVSLVLTFYINRIQPINLLNDKSMVKIGFNKAFFTLQFVISLALILSAVVIVKQVQFIKNKPLGFEREIIEARLPKGGKPSDLYTLKTKLNQHTLFKSVSLSNGNPVSANQQIRFELDDKEFYSPYFMAGDEGLIKTLGLQLKAGTVPSPSTGGDKVVNEKFIRHFNIEDPIGAPVPGGKGEKIIGVVSDFNVSSLKQEIPLYMIGYSEAPSRLLINYSGAPLDDAKHQIQVYWKEVFPNSPVTYSFLGEQLVSKHKDDLQFSRIIVTFSLVCIVMSCFGLFALAQSSCQKKGKEIAIRKSLGASTRSVVYVLITDFGKWVILSFGLASMLGYFGIRHWMETFAYRTNIDWPVFAITLGIGMCFFLLAISSETVKAAKANPINGLRYE
jgi:putative ABC transport system permease protein